MEDYSQGGGAGGGGGVEELNNLIFITDGRGWELFDEAPNMFHRQPP